MAGTLTLSDYSAPLGTTITATASGLTVGSTYSMQVSGSTSEKIWTQRDYQSKTWSFTPTSIGYTTFYLYENNELIDSRSVMITSSGGGGGVEPEPEPEDKASCRSWVFQQSASGEVVERTSDGWATIQFTVTADNVEDFKTRGRITGGYVVSGNNEQDITPITGNINILANNENSFLIEVSDWYWENNVKSKTFSIVVYYSTYLYASDTSQGMNVDCTSKIMYATVDYTPQVQYEDFYWGDGTTYIKSDDDFSVKVTANAWLDLIAKVNEVTGSNISTSGVYSGGTFYDYHYNDVADALGVSYTAVSKEKCTATMFNALRNAYQKKAGLS